MSHFTSHVESETVVRTVSVAQPSLLVSSATTPVPKAPIGAQLFSVQHSSLSDPVLSHVAPAHSSSTAEESAEVPAAHVIVEHAALGLQQRVLSAPVLSQVAPAHSCSLASGSATELAAQSMVEHGARATHVAVSYTHLTLPTRLLV